MRTNSTTPADETTLFLGDGWSDPLEAGIRNRIRGFIEEMIDEELAVALGRGRYERRRHDDATPRVSRRAMPCRFPVIGTAIASASSSAPLARSRSPSRGRA